MVVIGDELRTSVANSIHHERGRCAAVIAGALLIAWALAVGGGGPRTVAAIIVGGLVMTAGLLAPYAGRRRAAPAAGQPFAALEEAHDRIADLEHRITERDARLDAFLTLFQGAAGAVSQGAKQARKAP